MKKCFTCKSIVKDTIGHKCKFCLNSFKCVSCNKIFDNSMKHDEFRHNCEKCGNKIKHCKGIELIKFYGKVHGVEVKTPDIRQTIRVIKDGKDKPVTSFQTE